LYNFWAGNSGSLSSRATGYTLQAFAAAPRKRLSTTIPRKAKQLYYYWAFKPFICRLNVLFLHMAIKQIILDLGGVLININYQAPKLAFEQLGITNFDDFYSQKAANPLFEALETGNITNDAFIASVKTHLNPNTTTQQVINAWNSILLQFRPTTIAYLQQLKNTYNIYALSNTNAIHAQSFEATFLQQFGHPITQLFKQTYYSHQINYRKPYTNCYQYVLQHAQLNPTETLFVDDSEVNLPAPKQLGVTTHLLLPNQMLEDVLPNYLISS
jgi:glucose-1-phosphatase